MIHARGQQHRVLHYELVWFAVTLKMPCAPSGTKKKQETPNKFDTVIRLIYDDVIPVVAHLIMKIMLVHDPIILVAFEK